MMKEGFPFTIPDSPFDRDLISDFRLPDDRLRWSFRLYDVDNSGSIALNEMENVRYLIMNRLFMIIYTLCFQVFICIYNMFEGMGQRPTGKSFSFEICQNKLKWGLLKF